MKLALHWQVIIGLVLGTVYAWLAVTLGWNDFTIDYIKPFGDIFIRVLKLIAVPLVLFSIISGVTSLGDPKKLGRMGIKTLAIYLVTTMSAVVVGLVLVNLFQPGAGVDEELRVKNRIEYEVWRDANGVQRLDEEDYRGDPANAEILAEVEKKSEREAGESEKWAADKLNKAKATQQSGPLQPLVDVFPPNIFQALSDMEMLQIIFFAVFFGIILVTLPKATAEPVLHLVQALNDVFVQMVWVVMKAMPIFVFALMAGQIVQAAGADQDRFNELLRFLLHYSAVLVLGLAFMVFVFYPTLVSLFVKKVGYLGFMRGMRDAQITAFSTSSSVATLPVTMRCVEHKIGVSKRTTSFVLPIGATVNMDGTSLYQAVAVVSMAQFHLVDLTWGQQAVIVLTATLASIGAAAVPSAGLVLMIIVLESVGLNPAWIALIFPVDRILDMCRTVVNVTGDGAVSTIIASTEDELQPAGGLQEPAP